MREYADAEEDRAAELTPPPRPAAPWRLKSVEALSGFRLRVRFNDATPLTSDTMHKAKKQHGTWVVR